MSTLNGTLLSTRECWLPFIQQFAITHGWDMRAINIEKLADRVAPYLLDSSITTPRDAERILSNYYEDAPVIHLLLYDNSRRSSIIWQDLLDTCVSTLHNIGIDDEQKATQTADIQRQCREMLAQHSYQTSLWATLVAFVQSLKCARPNPVGGQ
jgi:hypothetical protein